MHTPPIVSFIGYSGSGKTTFLERLIPQLKALGVRVAVVKHDAHGLEIDKEGKDSWRFTQAGADVVAMASGEESALVLRGEVTPEEVVQLAAARADIVLTEGYKFGARPRIAVHRAASGQPLPLPPEDLLAIVTDAPPGTATPCFGLEDYDGVARFLVQRFLPAKGGRHG